MILLNIGGTCYTTSASTLETHPSFFATLVNWQVPTEKNQYFIDRDPTHFRYILNFLRGSKCLPDDPLVLKELLQEADFYCIEELKNNIQTELQKSVHVGSIQTELYLIRQKIDLMHN